MKQGLVNAMLTSSLESADQDVVAEAQELSERLYEEAGETTPQEMISERLAVEGDVDIVEGLIEELTAGGEVSNEALDRIQAVAVATLGRYGIGGPVTSLESDNPDRQPLTLANLKDAKTTLESALNVTMEGWEFKDLWNHLNILNRELPLMRDNIEVLKNYDGQQKINFMYVKRLFAVDGELASSIPGAGAHTASVVEELIALGNAAIDSAKKGAEIIFKADWSNPDEAEKAIKQITALNNPAETLMTKFHDEKVLCNRTITVKGFDVKGAGSLGKWSRSVTIKTSGIKFTTDDYIFMTVGAVIGSILVAAKGGNKRTISVKDMVGGLEKIHAAGSKSQAIRAAAPKKWREHETFVKRLKEFRKNDQANLAIRLVSELDRMGWESINAGFDVILYVVRHFSELADQIRKLEQRDAKHR